MATNNRAAILITAEDLTKEAFGSVNAGLDKIKEQTFSVKEALTGLAGGFTVAAFAEGVRGALEFADQLGKVSARTGIAVEALSALKYQADLSDVSFEELTVGLQHFNKSIDENSDAFTRLKVRTTDAGGAARSTDAIFADVAERFSRIENGAGKTALAIDLFGKSGARLIPLLNQGKAGLAEFREEAEKLGIVVSDKLAKASEEFNDNIKRVTASGQAFKLSIANELLPTLNEFVEQLLKGREIFGSFGSALLNIGVGVDPFTSLGDNIKKYREQIDALQEARTRGAKGGLTGLSKDDLDLLNRQIETAQKRLQFLQFQQQQQALRGVEPGAVLDANDARSRRPTTPLEKAPAPIDKEAQSRFDARIESLQKELEGAQKLSEFEKVLTEIQAGRYGKLSIPQQARITALAGEIDQTKQAAEAQKQFLKSIEEGAKDEVKQQDEASKAVAAFNDRIEAQRKSFEELADPVAKVRDKINQLDFIQLGTGAQRLTPELENVARALLDIERIDAQFSGPAESFLRAIDPARQYREELEKIDALQEHGQLTAEQASQARVQTFRKIETADSDAERIRNLADPARELRRELEIIDEKTKDGIIDPETAKRAGDAINLQINDTLLRSNSLVKDLGLTFTSAFEDAVVSGSKFQDVLQGIVQDLERLVLRKTVTEPLLNALGGALGKFSFGSSGDTHDIGEAGDIIYAGARAGGGSVGAGEFALVGEQGPELVGFGRSGTVFPNSSLGGQTIINNYVDAHGADAGVEMRIRAAQDQTARATLAAVTDGKRRRSSR